MDKKSIFLYSFASLASLLFLWGCHPHTKVSTMNNEEFSNHLIRESSPYLLQHSHNPVDWYPWGKQALEKAKHEDKLMVISIGYAACHWCHVMEHESFEDTTVARVMNDHFISVKVDREERPDVDHLYMDAVQLITGQGGWPLNVIALPDGKPIYAVTYLPKQQWIQLLSAFDEYYKKDRKRLEEQAENIAHGIRTLDFKEKRKAEDTLSLANLDTLFRKWEPKMDMQNGGRIGAPKFPMPANYKFLLQYFFLTKNAKALEFLTASLEKIGNGGIYDQIGGGFARYSVDDRWFLPHFEKMLYDNALLISVYSDAYRLTKEKRYAYILCQTLAWIRREMTSPEGAFYSSLDADSDGEEGKYYVWKSGELEKLLGSKSTLILEYYGVNEIGNWEHGNNILHRKQSPAAFAKANGLSESEFEQLLENAHRTLLAARQKRVKPAVDDKVLTAWNSMMISAYIDAYKALGDTTYLLAAKKNAEFLMIKCMTREYRLNRNYKNGRSNINAFLDDYAFTIKAFTDIYEVTFENRWLIVAKNLSDYTLSHFYDSKSGMFFYTSNLDHVLVSRKKEMEDNVIPSSNSVMAENLQRLGHLYDNREWLKISAQMSTNVLDETIQYGPFYSNWASVLTNRIHEPYQIAIVGDSCIDFRKEFNATYLPDAQFLGAQKSGSRLTLLKDKFRKGETLIYICRGRTCGLPVNSVEDAIRQMNPGQNQESNQAKNAK